MLSDMKVVRRKSSRCTSIQKVTAALLLSFLIFGSPALVSTADRVGQNEAQHVHDVLQGPELGGGPVQSHVESHNHRFVHHT